jgi:molecular chaperone DnaJ
VRIPVRTDATGVNRATNDPTATAEMELVLTFDQAALGTTATVTVTDRSTCPACRGGGTVPAARGCARCGGAGNTARVSGGITIRTACPDCDGTGRPPPQPCERCAGTGVTTGSQELTVRVPAGVDDGTRLRVRPRGPHSDALDAVVRVTPHPYFGRRGLDITLPLPVTLAEVALGAVVTVPTLDGAVAIRVPAGTPHGRTLRVARRGIATAERTGDLLVTIRIDVPAQPNDAQRAALEAFAAATDSPRHHLEAAPPSPTAGSKENHDRHDL